MDKLTADQIIKYISEVMDAPCNYRFGDIEVAEFMCDNAENWCAEKCFTGDFEKCWRKFFELLVEKGY